MIDQDNIIGATSKTYTCDDINIVVGMKCNTDI